MTVDDLIQQLTAYHPSRTIYLEVFSHNAPARALRVTSVKELNVSPDGIIGPIILVTSDAK